jgi:hypothetical protein
MLQSRPFKGRFPLNTRAVQYTLLFYRAVCCNVNETTFSEIYKLLTPDIKLKEHFMTAFHVLLDISGCLTLTLAYCHRVRNSVMKCLFFY